MYIREKIRRQLSAEVMDIRDLKMSLETLQEFSELENTIDSSYLPVEQLYFLLRSANILINIIAYMYVILVLFCRSCHPRLPRSEIEKVDNLRTEWKNLSELVDKVMQIQRY